MENEKMENEKILLKTISLKDLWNIFRGCFWFVFAAGVISTSLFYGYAVWKHSPLYSSSGTLYLISNADKNGDGQISPNEWTTDYTLAHVVISDTIYVLQSRPVLNAVGEDIGLKPGQGYGALRGSISINNPEDTRVLEITVTHSDPKVAQKIVDSLCVRGPEAAAKILQYDRITSYEKGTYSEWVVNQVSVFAYLKYGIIFAGLVYLIFIGMFLFDNYIHTEEDIDRYLGVSILGDIPDANAPKKKNKYSNYKGYSKRVGKQYYASSNLNIENKE